MVPSLNYLQIILWTITINIFRTQWMAPLYHLAAKVLKLSSQYKQTRAREKCPFENVFPSTWDRPVCLEMLSRLIRKIISSEQKKKKKKTQNTWEEPLCLRHTNLSQLSFKSSRDPSKSLPCAVPRGHLKLSQVWHGMPHICSVNGNGRQGCFHQCVQEKT